MEHTHSWICNVINSCNNGFHFRSADVLIYLFIERYGDDDKAGELEMLRQSKWNMVHGILV